MTSFLIDEHATSTALPNNNVAEAEATQNTPLPPSSQNCSPSSAKAPANVSTTTSADENEVLSEAEDMNTNTHNSPTTKCSSKERDDLKERLKAEKKAAKKLMKEIHICKIILEEMEVIILSRTFASNIRY